MEKLILSVKDRLFVLSASLVLIIAFSISHANAQGSVSDEAANQGQNNPAWVAMESLTKRSAAQIGRVHSSLGQELALPPLALEDGHSDAIKDPEKFGTVKQYGPNSEDQYQMLFPPLTEFQRLADSKAVNEMLKELITKRQPVMAQTFFMVENGAASGYFQALNTVSNTLSNVVQSNDFQMKIMDLTDPSGEMKQAWLSDVYNRTSKNDNGGGQGWAAALLAAQGDKVNFNGRAGAGGAAGSDKGFDSLPQPKPFDFSVLHESATTSQSSKDGASIKLSTLLFDVGGKGKQGTGINGFANENITQLRDSFRKLAGDVEIKFEPSQESPHARKIKLQRIPPEEGSAQVGNRRGFIRAQFEETAIAWENLHKILYQHCTIDKEKKNQQDLQPGKNGAGNMGKHETTATYNYDKIAWERAGAPDLPMSLDLDEMLFKLFLNGRTIDEVNCEEVNLTADQIPDSFDAVKADNLEECKSANGATGGCLRNRLILTLSYLIGRSRTLHTYLILQSMTERFATSVAQQTLVNKVFAEVYGAMEPIHELEMNMSKWRSTMAVLRAETDNSIGGLNHRGDSSNQQTQMIPGR